MKYIRIGNDIHFVWRFFTKVTTGNIPYNLEGKDIKIIITDIFGNEFLPSFSVVENSALFYFYGKDQSTIGDYTLTMFENKGELGMKAIDKITPFRLVGEQDTVVKEIEGGCVFPTLDIETIELSSEFNHGIDDYNELRNKPSINGVTLQGDKSLAELGIEDRHPYTSLDRIKQYLYKVTFDKLPEDNGGESPVVAGCSSYVANGKLYTNLDWDYDNTASFIVRTRDFEGQSFIKGLNDETMDDALIAQLPYRVHRGINNYGIKVAAHILYNDWSWTSAGEGNISLTRLPFLVLTRVKSMATISQDLDGILDNLYAPEGLATLGYLLQILVTDGTTSYVLMPPTSEGQGYILQNITSNPKLANFRWVNKAEVTRGELQRRPTGVERWNMMPCSLEDLRFTKAYEQPTRLSEFIGLRGTDKDSTDAQLEAIYNDARAEYLQRERDGKTWQTMESAVYGNRLEALYIQEDWSKNLIPATTEYVDKADDELQEAIIAEAVRAGESEAALARGLIAEQERAEQAERTLAGAIGAESERAQEAEGELSRDLTQETQRATQSEGVLANAIESEETRATGAESGLADDISEESERAQSAESTLSDAIEAEETRAKEAEGGLNDAIEAEETRAKAKESELGTAINTESQRAQGAEGNLSTAIATETGRATGKETELATAISQETARATGAEGGLDTRLTNVEGKIPSQASSTNQLADKGFVNSSIATETAHYIYKTNAQGEKLPFDSVAELEAYSGTVTNNDYAFVAGTDSEGNSYYDRYKATDSQGTITWAKEYRLNNSSFTAAQWAAINSGLSGTDKAALDAALAFIETFGNIVTHNASEFATAAQGSKADTALQPSALAPYRTSANQDTIDNGIKGRLDTIENKESGWDAKYNKPSGGIPKSDLASGVKESLEKADSALQQHQSLAEYRKASQQDVIDAAKATKTELEAEERARGEADAALATAISGKVDKVAGKGLSTNDYTDAEAAKAEAGSQAKTLLDDLGLSVVNGMLCITYNV